MLSEAAPVVDGENEAMALAPRCSECPAGFGVSRPCHRRHQARNESQHEAHEPLEDTQCEPCVAGVTFSDAPGRHAACRACRACPPNSRVKRECDAAHDAECECERDHYAEITYQTPGNETEAAVEPGEAPPHARHKHGAAHVVPVLACRPCELCPHGYGAARACSATHNTVCRKCPSATYSSVLSASLGCSVCTVCRDDQVTLHECTPIQDTVCAGKTRLSLAAVGSLATVVVASQGESFDRSHDERPLLFTCKEELHNFIGRKKVICPYLVVGHLLQMASY